MDVARCTLNNRQFTAQQFEQLPADELEQNRRNLVCVGCGYQAFFRKASRRGVAACFGARPHGPQCQLGAEDYPRQEGGIGADEEIRQNDGVLVVDLAFGAAPGELHIDQAPEIDQRNRGGRAIQGDGRHRAQSHRRLSTLLRHLRHSPGFRNSMQQLEAPGQIRTSVRDFFIEFQDIENRHLGRVGGFWGMITDARQGADALWLNSGGRRDISICVPDDIAGAFLGRFDIDDPEDLAGAYVLVIGTPLVSQYGKAYLPLNDIAFITADLA